MEQLDYIIILLYFLGLIAVSVVMSRKIKNSEDMFTQVSDLEFKPFEHTL